jgi:trans-aconitate 2-methyltransferase
LREEWKRLQRDSDKVEPNTFTTPAERVSRFSDACMRRVPREQACRVLDLGCGSGDQLIHFATSWPAAACVGIDIGEGSIELAGQRARAAALESRVRFAVADYLKFRDDRFDVILSDGVLHNVPCDDTLLYTKLASDLAPGGILVVAIPYGCAFNHLLWTARRVARHLRGRLLDRLILAVAKWMHRGWPAGMLAQRVGYMYVVPHRWDGPALRQGLAAVGLQLVDQQMLPQASLGQAKHRLLVFRKRAE